jgi:hypothetical protein
LILEHTRNAYPGQVAGQEIHDLYRQHTELQVTQHDDIQNYGLTVLRRRTS